MRGLRPPGLEFRILCLEDSVISIISPSSGGSPGPFSLYVHKGGLKPDSFHFFLCLLGFLLLSPVSTMLHRSAFRLKDPLEKYTNVILDFHNSLGKNVITRVNIIKNNIIYIPVNCSTSLTRLMKIDMNLTLFQFEAHCKN